MEDYYKISDGRDDEALGMLKGPLAEHFEGYITYNKKYDDEIIR